MKKLLVYLTTLFGAAVCAYAVTNATFQWTHSPSPEVQGYKIYYGTSSGKYTNSVTVPYGTEGDVINLQEGVTYYFAATAFRNTDDGRIVESPFSEETQYTPSNGQPSRPSAVLDFLISKME